MEILLSKNKEVQSLLYEITQMSATRWLTSHNKSW